jgi:hypothetical protein
MFYKFKPGLIVLSGIAISLTSHYEANAFTFKLSAEVLQPENNQVFTVNRPEETVTVGGNTRGGFSITKQQNDRGQVLFTLQNRISHAGIARDNFISRTVDFDTLQPGGTIDFGNFAALLIREVGVGQYDTQSFTQLFRGGNLSQQGQLPEGAIGLPGFKTDIHRWRVVSTPEPTSSVSTLVGISLVGLYAAKSRKKRS